MRGFNLSILVLSILVCSPKAKLVAYETSGYLFTLLEQTPDYKAKSSILGNLRTLLSLLLPMPPWSGPPTSHAFGLTWRNVKELLRGRTAIAFVHLRGDRAPGCRGRQAELDIPRFLVDREQRIIRQYKASHKEG